MKASRFNGEPIIGMIKEQGAGRPTADVCRKRGVSSAARRLKVLEDENARLKELLAEAMPDNARRQARGRGLPL